MSSANSYESFILIFFISSRWIFMLKNTKDCFLVFFSDNLGCSIIYYLHCMLGGLWISVVIVYSHTVLTKGTEIFGWVQKNWVKKRSFGRLFLTRKKAKGNEWTWKCYFQWTHQSKNSLSTKNHLRVHRIVTFLILTSKNTFYYGHSF